MMVKYWENGKTIYINYTIFKNRQTSDPENYWGVTLLITTQKLQKMHTYLNVNKEQWGFHPDWSTMDAIFTVHQIGGEVFKHKCLVDIKKSICSGKKISDVRSILVEKAVLENY